MKKLFLLALISASSLIISAQLPQEFSYQAVARNAAGVIIANQSIALRFKIHSGSPTGTVEYSETRTVGTNQFGLFTVAVGSAGATNVTGSIAAINWSASAKYLQVEMDPLGGSSFTDMGTLKLLSVPYAMHSGSSASDKWNSNGNHIYNNNSGNIGIGLTTPGFPLSFAPVLGDKISLWSNSTNSYGFGIQSSLLQIHSDISAADIAFGYGSSSAFTENMRIRGNGNVGIGITIPTDKLDVNGNINIRTGGTIKTAGAAGAPNQVLTTNASGNLAWASMTSANSVGFGSWGDCSMNNISEYNPVSDATGHSGYAVSISGNFAIVGAYEDMVGSSQLGSASIYHYNGSNWVFMQKLIDPTAVGSFPSFGYSVSISGNRAIVGCYRENNRGSASIFEYNGSNWVLMQKITDIDGAANDDFGYSVSISGNFALVGARGDNVQRGSVSFYQYAGTTWTQLQKLNDASSSSGDEFGCSVSISGNNAIVGEMNGDVGANADQGSAFIYHFDGFSWVMAQQITDAAGQASDGFGISVSISGNYLIAGAFFDQNPPGPIGQGSAIIFHYDGSNWVGMQKITEGLISSGGSFGLSVSISGDYAIVGAPYADVGSNDAQGAAVIYMRIGNIWQKQQYITDPGGGTSNTFGDGVSIDGTNKRFLVGADNAAGGIGKAIFGKIN
jgi:hypothetical protein